VIKAYCYSGDNSISSHALTSISQGHNLTKALLSHCSATKPTVSSPNMGRLLSLFDGQLDSIWLTGNAGFVIVVETCQIFWHFRIFESLGVGALISVASLVLSSSTKLFVHHSSADKPAIWTYTMLAVPTRTGDLCVGRHGRGEMRTKTAPEKVVPNWHWIW